MPYLVAVGFERGWQEIVSAHFRRRVLPRYLQRHTLRGDVKLAVHHLVEVAAHQRPEDDQQPAWNV